MATKSDSMTMRGKLVYKDKSPIAGARVKIWETDPLQKKNKDDLIVDDTTGSDGHFSGTGVWKDSGLIDKPTYRYEVTLDRRTETGRNVLSSGFFESFGMPWESPKQAAEDRAEGSIHIAGTIVFNDGSPMSGAQVRIWETDPLPNNPDDLIVDMRTDDRGHFAGAGFWKDGGIELAATYRYEVTYKGEAKKGANITNPLNFFAKLNTNILSEEEKSIRLSGRIVFKNGARSRAPGSTSGRATRSRTEARTISSSTR